MRKFIALVIIGSVVTCVSVVTSHAAELPIEKQQVFIHKMTAPAMAVDFIELVRPATPGEAVVTEVKTIIGVKPVIRPRCNSPG